MLFLILTLVTSPAWAKSEFENRAFEAVAAEDPPFSGVEESLRMVFEEEDDDVRARATEYFGVVGVPTVEPEIARADELLGANADRFLSASHYRQERLEAARRAVDLLLVSRRAPRERPRSMSDQEAWTEARRAVLWAERDPSWHAWDVRRAFLRNLEREVVRPTPRPVRLDDAEVLERLRAVRRELAQAGLEHFFLPTDFAFVEQVESPVDAQTVEATIELRSLVSRFDELRDAEWSEFGSKHLQTRAGLKVVVHRPTHGKRKTFKSEGGVIEQTTALAISPGNLAFVGFLQHDNTLEALSQPRFYEARYHAFLDDILNYTIERLASGELPALEALLALRVLLATDLVQLKANRRLRTGYNLGQVSHLVRTRDDPDYFRARDLRARRSGRPSLAAYLRRGSSSRLAEFFRGDLSKVFDVGAALSVAGLDRFLRGGRTKAPPRNKSLRESRAADRERLWTFAGRAGLTASRLQIDTPDLADLRGPFRAWTLPTGREAFGLASELAVEPTAGSVVPPRAEHFALASVVVERDGRTLREGLDYGIEVGEDEDIPLLRLTEPGRVRLRFGYVDRPDASGGDLFLDALDVGPLPSLLRKGKLTALASRIEAESGRDQRLSASQLAHLVGAHSRYSYDDKLPREPEGLARGPFAMFSGYLKPHGRACVQCDGANALFADMLRVIFENDPRVEIREVSCLIRKPFRNVLTALGHRRTQVYFEGRRIAILDATPWILDRPNGSDDEEDRVLPAAPVATDAPAAPASNAGRSQGLDAWARIRKTRDALVKRRAVQRDLAAGDPTSMVPSAFELVRASGKDPLTSGAAARRLRRYLERLSGRDPTMPASELEGDAVALAMLDELLAEIERASGCESSLISNEASSHAGVVR